MSECTSKLENWAPQGRPQEGPELDASRQLIREVIFSLYREKAEILKTKGMTAQPISLSQIYLQVCSKVAIRRNCRVWPYPHHEKRWWDRRTNEVACPKFYADGIAKIVSASAGYYEPNPQLFSKKPLEASL